MTDYADRLHTAVRDKGTPALVGLDPRFDLLPASIICKAREASSDENEVAAIAFEEFCKRIVDVVSPLVPAVKPQSAFFEQLGAAGCLALQRVICYARQAGLIVICDAKRGDIGSTAQAYAQAYLAGEDPQAAPFAADALTVNPYLGADTLEPFIDTATQRGAGIYVLVRTSNPGAGIFQDHTEQDRKLYQKVAASVEESASQAATKAIGNYGCVGAVVGATYPRELEQLRQAMPHVPLLIPGYGAQGGGAADVAAAFDQQGFGAIINSSRGINFAYQRGPYKDQFSSDQWEQAIEQATREMIKDIADNTPAGSLQ